MRFEAVTIKDIAKALGVSTSTVSRALRGSHEINEETKQMVQAYADRMQYQPNPIARSLKESSSKAIGVIVPEIDNTFFAQALTGIDAFAHQRGYHVVIFQSFESYDREIRNTQQLVSRRVDGLLVSLSSQTKDLSHFRLLQERGLPIVFFDRVPESLEAHTVTANNFQGTYEAIRHLLAQGRKRIAHITSKPWLSTTKERLAGHQAALREQGLPFNESYAKYCANGGMVASEVEEAVKDLLALPEKPDALFTASDRITNAALLALRQAGVSIPEDLALVGFTNLAIAELLQPALSAVSQPARQMGQTATELIIKLIESKKPVTAFERKVLDTELVVRASSKC
jgi:LacI family transcriptional regulator